MVPPGRSKAVWMPNTRSAPSPRKMPRTPVSPARRWEIPKRSNFSFDPLRGTKFTKARLGMPVKVPPQLNQVGSPVPVPFSDSAYTLGSFSLCRNLGPQGFQAVQGVQKGLVLFGEVEANEVVHRLPEEAGTRNSPHAHLFRQVLAEPQVAVIAELRDIQQDVVGPLRRAVGQPQCVQAPQEQVPLVGVLRQESVVIVLAEVQSGDDRLLEGGRRAHGEEVVDLFDPVRDLRRGDGVPQPPAGDGVGLGQRRAGDGPLPHSRKGGEVDVPVGGVDDVLIDLVGDDIGVVFLRQGGDDLQLHPGEDPAAGVGGVAENQGLGPLTEGVLQDLWVEAEVRGRQGHVDGLRAAEDGVRPIVLIEG